MYHAHPLVQLQIIFKKYKNNLSVDAEFVFCYSFNPSCMSSILNCKYFTLVYPSSPGSSISSDKISPKISIPDSLEIVSIGLVSTFVSTNKTCGGVSSKNDNNDLICSGEPFSSVSIAQIYPSSKP